jgi:hypothetical protein
MKAWDESDGKLRFWHRHEQRPMLQGMAAVGLALLVCGVPLGLLVHDEIVLGIAMALGIIGAVCAGVAGVGLALSTSVLVDPAARVVRLGEGEVPFSDLGFVVTLEIMVQNGNNQSPMWVVAVVPDGRGSAAQVEDFARARELLDEHATMGPAMADQAAETLAHIKRLAMTDPLPLASYFESTRAWRAGEKLARTLGIPLLDLTGSPTLRHLAQLDTPLQDLLAQEILPSRPPGRAPSEVMELAGQGVALSWVRHNSAVWVLGVTALFFLGLCFVPGAWMFCVPVVLLLGLLAVVSDVGHGSQTLLIEGEQLRYTAFRKELSLRLDQIELIRESERSWSVDFVTDEATVRAHLPSMEAALWVRLRVEELLKARGSGPRLASPAVALDRA